MSELKQTIVGWQQKIDALSQRERVLLLVSAVVVIVMMLQVLLLDPVLADRERVQKQQKELSQKIQQYSAEITVLEAQLQVGVDRQKIKQREQLQQQLDKLNEEIQQSVVAMIPPKLMATVLEQLLKESKGLKLISLENKPVVPVLASELADSNSSSHAELAPNNRKKKRKTSEQENGKASRQALYNHSFVLQLHGDYQETVEFFERLSSLPWRFYWDDMTYKVEEYPTAIITLQVHTVSMSEEWIGV